MSKQLLKYVVLVGGLLLVANLADAQRRSRSTRTTTTTSPAQDTIPKQNVQQNTNPASVGQYNPYANVPIIVAPQVGGFNDSVKLSLRNDGATEKSLYKERTPLPYEHLRQDDAFYTQRVWRDIDIREKVNLPFRYQVNDDNGDQRFVSIVVNAVRRELKKGNAIAFSPDDDRFTTFLDSAKFEKALTGGGTCDTIPIYDLNDPTKIDHYEVVCNQLAPDDIVKFRIKEEWIFDREASRMFVRIIGIAPMKTIMGLDKVTERGATPLFWIYYPDLRPTLARHEVYNPKNMGMSRMTWEELFESRMFGSYIVKSTIDNPYNRFIRNIMRDNPMMALLEGENIKDKIFNFEQNLWQY